MKRLHVVFNQNLTKPTAIEEVSSCMDNMHRHNLSEISWPAYGYRPEVTFAVAHTGSHFLLKYYVKEDCVEVKHREINDLVHLDSCVEVFIGFQGESEYYNYEFNCLGVCSAGFGQERHGRRPVPENIIKMVKAKSFLQSVTEVNKSLIYWELTLSFPLEAFYFHKLESLVGAACKGNFYKCGDDLPQAHFLTWNTILSAAPDFHRPEYFGEILFG